MNESTSLKFQAVIISDLHLQSNTPKLLERLLQMLDELPTRSQSLYILGDLFDFWYGDDAKEQYINQLKQGLKNLTQKGVELFIQQGNRDFLLKKRFAKETGATLLATEHELTIDQQSILLMHGDTLCTNDVGYQKFRRVMHCVILQRLWLLLPIKFRLSIVAKVQYKSKEISSQKAAYIVDVNQQEVERVMYKHGAMTLIHGHTHRPNIHEFDIGKDNIGDGKAKRMVLGDWGDEYWWIEVSSSALELKHKSIDECW